MDKFERRTFGRRVLMLVAILSLLVIGEMVLVSAEDRSASGKQPAYQALRQE
jgi:hypothetical protein